MQYNTYRWGESTLLNNTGNENKTNIDNVLSWFHHDMIFFGFRYARRPMQGLATLKAELLVFAQQRKAQFENGEPFHFHSLATTEEATALVEAAEKEVTDIRDQVRYQAQQLFGSWLDSSYLTCASLSREAAGVQRWLGSA